MREHNHYRTIWISDVHLGTRGSQADFLCDFLKFNHSEKLYLVGDIIDGWALHKGNTLWNQSHTNVIRRILTKSKRQTDVVYVPGNHDEFMRRYDKATFGNIKIRDQIVHTCADGRKILVLHGDQFDDVMQTQKWLANLGDTAYTFALWMNRGFNRLRRRMGYGYWSLSQFLKQRVKGAVNYISQFEDEVIHYAQKRGVDAALCGHIHHAEIRQLDDFVYYNCGDWVESCTALVEHGDGRIELVQWVEMSHENTDRQ